EAGRAAFADDVALLRGAREHDERQHRHLGRFEPRDLTARVWKIVRRRWLKLTGGRHAVGRVTGHHLIMCRGGIEQAGGRVAHGADQRGFIDLFGEQRHDFAEPDARHDGANWFEFAAHIRWRVWFRIPDVDVARPALKENEKDGFGFAPAGFALGG